MFLILTHQNVYDCLLQASIDGSVKKRFIIEIKIREAGGKRTSPDKRSCLLFKDKKEAEEEERIGNKSW